MKGRSKMEYVVLTGMSGAGKSQATHILEDLGYYCVSNLPVNMIRTFIRYCSEREEKLTKLAFVIDARGDVDFAALLETKREMISLGHKFLFLFVDCSTAVLMNRYKETRRVHPLVALFGMSVGDALEEERKMLKPMRDEADFVIDTTSTTVHQLRDKLLAILTKNDNEKILVNCLSFGYKYGIPADADLAFDVRCFPNPFWIAELKEKTGLDDEVKQYLFGFDEVNVFLSKLYDMIDYLLPLYMSEGKSQLTVAIGCTGGKHRSVAFAEALGQHLQNGGVRVVVQHRDIIKKFIGDK